MKKTKTITLVLTLILITVSISKSNAQQITPSIFNEKLNQKIITRTTFKTKNESNNALPDSTITTQVDTLTSTTNNNEKVTIYGIGSTDFLQLKDITAAGGIGIGIKPGPIMSVFVSFNFSGSLAKKTAVDSVPLSAIYFPDIQSSSVAGSLSFRLFRKWKAIPEDQQIFITGDGSLQERNLEKDSAIYNLSIANINYGLKYQWAYTASKQTVIFTFGAFLNDIFLNKNSKDNFNALFSPDYNKNNYKLPGQINGVSFLASFQFNNVVIYARTYTDRHAAGDLAFTVGLRATGKFFSF